MLNKFISIFCLLLMTFGTSANWFSKKEIPVINLGWWQPFILLTDCQWEIEPSFIECTLTTYIDIPSNGIPYQAKDTSGILVKQGALPEHRIQRNTKTKVSLYVKGASTVFLKTPAMG